jgi:hypothetical protein
MKVETKERIPVTPEIRKAIFELMKQENDTGLKSIHSGKWYREEVAKVLKLTEVNNPKIRSYENHVKQLRDRFKQVNPLDKEWHLGTLEQYPLSPEALAKIIEYKLKAERIKPGFTGWITIRIALWMDRLRALPLSIDYLYFFAFKYAIREQLYEMLGDDYQFTPEYDNNGLIRILKEYPDKLLKEDFKPVTNIDITEMILSVPPELVDELADKHKKHVKNNQKRMVSNENE